MKGRVISLTIGEDQEEKSVAVPAGSIGVIQASGPDYVLMSLKINRKLRKVWLPRSAVKNV